MMGLRTRLAVMATAALAMAALAVSPAMATVYRVDGYEPDDTTRYAKTLPELSIHNLHVSADKDFSLLSADATGQAFAIETQFIDGPRLNTTITVFRKNAAGGEEQVAQNTDGGTWDGTSASELVFIAPAPGYYYVRVSPASPSSLGTYLLYEVKGIGRRVAGMDRYETAAEISYLMFPGTHLPATYPEPAGPDTLVVANGHSFTDALAGGLLAARHGAPLLLTGAAYLHPVTADEILRLTVSKQLANGMPLKVYLVGNTTSVSNQVFADLQSLDPVTEVVRLAGGTAYSTAAAVAVETSKSVGVSDTVFVVNAAGWADALAVGPVAQAAEAPVLLVDRNTVPPQTSSVIRALGAKHVVVAGGPGVVSTACANALDAIEGVDSVVRVAGTDRYKTAKAVAEYGVTNHGLDNGRFILASGLGFADALPTASMAARMNAPLLLTKSTVLVPEVSQYASGMYGPTGPSYIVGGSGVLSPGVYAAFKALWRSMHPPIG